MKPYNFDEQKEKGKIGETVVIDYFQNVLGKEIEDLSENPAFQKLGYDFIVKDTGELIEIKTDNRKSNDLIIETVNSVRYNTSGWIYTTVSDWIAFYKSKHNKIYLIKTIELKAMNHLLPMHQSIAVAKDSADKKSLDYGICKKVNIYNLSKSLDSEDFIVFDLVD